MRQWSSFSTLLILLVSQCFYAARPVDAYSDSSSDNVVVYWGQASAGSQEPLSDYCQSDSVDIVVLSFLMTFYAADGLPEVNFANACSDTFSGTTLLKCDQIAADIQTCQAKGKKVLLSLGGAAGSYGFSSDSEGSSFATTLWDMFGGGTSDYRPFGSAVVDGFDLDIENANSIGYAAFVEQMRNLYSGGDYYISGAPQCPFPDASIGDALDNAWFDFVFIQFYNNYCGVNNPSQFNYDSDWQAWVSSTAVNKNVKLYVGVPGSSSAAGSGYTTPSGLLDIMNSISDKSSLGGVMIWDASQAFTNTIDSSLFIDGIKTMLGQVGSSPSSSSHPAASSVSSSVVATTSSEAAVTFESLSISQVAQNLYVDSAATSSEAMPDLPTSSIAEPTSSSTSTVELPSSSVVEVSTSSLAPSTSSVSDLPSSSDDPVSSSTSEAPLSFTTTVTQSNRYTATEIQYVTVTVYPGDITSTYTSVSTMQPTSASASSSLVASAVESAAGQASVVVDASNPSSSSAETSNTADCSTLTGVELANCENAYFATLSASSTCTDGAIGCVEGFFAKCDGSSWVTFSCPLGTVCTALPNGDTAYAIVTCDTEDDISRIFGTSSSKKIRRRNVSESEELERRSMVRRPHRHHAHHRRSTF
ncbi:glycoside hydrolase superfamily [Lipomyces tetrasporus]|uniref:chitinase n=1 Tax=Lipomyces tetrasporus TaxID=54092 RepID=A0AAD7QSF4_9ASCO|nr:glycoside hydrolase superfamily [Lipomyces tetrasporus]KAJ8100580.1 glycoside hydrolase superfamily [Lipomyces tetrasporus]